MKWDSTADAKLFACVMKVYDVKITGAKLEEVAALMGEDCTPKAITHRLSKLRNTANLDSTPSTPTSFSRATRTPASSRTRTIARTPSSSSKSAGKSAGKSGTKRPLAASNDAEAMGTYDDEDDEEIFKDNGKRLFEADIEGGIGKKVKTEVVEEGFDDVVALEG